MSLALDLVFSSQSQSYLRLAHGDGLALEFAISIGTFAFGKCYLYYFTGRSEEGHVQAVSSWEVQPERSGRQHPAARVDYSQGKDNLWQRKD